MTNQLELLKQQFPKHFNRIVLQHKAVNKVITFSENDNLYFLFTGMFSEVNNGNGINNELETYFVNYLIDKYNAQAIGRASAYALEDQTTFIGYDLKSASNEIWSQQNNFQTDDEDKVTSVDDDFVNSSHKNPINTILHTYFEKIDFPDDTLEFLNNLHEQVKPNFHVIPIKA
ncbi:MAG: hypothetical protein ACPGU8_03220 [Methylophilaceae bacterium]